MARRKAADAEDDNKVKPSETRAAISQKKLRSLLNSARSTQKDIDSIVGTHREQIANAVEKNYLHKGAFAVVKRLDRLEPAKLSDFLDCLDHYLDISGLRERAATAPSLPIGAAEEEDDEEGNVRAFPQPRGEAAE